MSDTSGSESPAVADTASHWQERAGPGRSGPRARLGAAARGPRAVCSALILGGPGAGGGRPGARAMAQWPPWLPGATAGPAPASRSLPAAG